MQDNQPGQGSLIPNLSRFVPHPVQGSALDTMLGTAQRLSAGLDGPTNKDSVYSQATHSPIDIKSVLQSIARAQRSK